MRSERVFDALYRRTREAMSKHGREADFTPPVGYGDYLVVNEFMWYGRLCIALTDVHMLHPRVIESLREVLQDFPGWLIQLLLERPHASDRWPGMGLYVRAHEVVDYLQREYFPPEYRDMVYRDGRLPRPDEMGE